MKIAFLSFYNGLANRGVETYVRELATRLTGSGHEVTVYQNGKSVGDISYKVKYLPSLFSLPDFEEKPDVLIPVNGRFQSVISRIWTLRHHKKMIISGQSGIGWDDRLNLYTFPDVFVGMTGFQCDWAKSVNSKVKIGKIPNGVDLNKFNPKVIQMDLDLPRPVVLYTAAFESIKRHHLLIEAMAKNSASMLLVGQGSLENSISQLADKLLGPKRFRIMALAFDRMPAVYRSADLFVYPTAPWESFGISILEAMASGLPIVATDDPIRREIVGNAGILTDPVNTDAFSASIEQALAKTNWGDTPRHQAEKYSWEIITSEYEKLFKKINP